MSFSVMEQEQQQEQEEEEEEEEARILGVGYRFVQPLG